MLRVVHSIKSGRVTASTLPRKLGTYSKTNQLYQAFRELGPAIGTEFLLKYPGSAQLRTLIQAATNKSEAFNGFAQRVASVLMARSRPMYRARSSASSSSTIT